MSSDHIRISHLIGKPSILGGWIIPRPPAGRVKPQLDAARVSSRTVMVRIRPDFPDSKPVHEVLVVCERVLKEAREKGEIRVIMDHGPYDTGAKRYRPETRIFKVGQIYELSTRDAFRVLGARGYMHAFEEVISEDDMQALTPGKPASSTDVNELQEKVRHLEGLVAAMQATQQQKPTKKRTLKDSLAANAEADAANEEG